MWQTIHYIYTSTRPIATKNGRLATYRNKILSITSHDPLITSYRGITWQTEKVRSPLSQDLWPTHLIVWWLRRGSRTPRAIWFLDHIVFLGYVTKWTSNWTKGTHAHTQSKVIVSDATFSWCLPEWYQLTFSRGIDDQRILDFEWTRRTLKQYW